MTALSGDHYQILGIAPTADANEIKRAWARGVKLHTPDVDPEGNRLLNEAKRTLLDPQARIEYDASLRFGDEQSALRGALDVARESGDGSRAVEILRELLALNPASHSTRNELGLALIYADRARDGIAVLQGLVERSPDNAVYWSNLGAALLETAREDEAGLIELTERAIVALRRAIALAPETSEYWIELSNVYAARNDFRGAARVCQEGIDADAKLTFEDFDLLLHMVLVQAKLQNQAGITECVGRIESIIPTSTEQRGYAGMRLVRLAGSLDDYGYAGEIRPVLDLMKRLDPDDPKLAEAAKDFEERIAVAEQNEWLSNDPAVVEPVRHLLGLYTAWYLDRIPEDEYTSYLDPVYQAFRMVPRPTLGPSLRRLQAAYPALWSLNPEMFAATLAECPAPRGGIARGGIAAGGPPPVVGAYGAPLPAKMSPFLPAPFNIAAAGAFAFSVVVIALGLKGGAETFVGFALLYVMGWFFVGVAKLILAAVVNAGR